MDSNGQFRLDGKVAVITGGSKGIGSGCARVFVQAGAQVVICAREKSAGYAFAEELNIIRDGSAIYVPCDVSVERDIQQVIGTAVEKYGRLDCLLNNAGYHPGFKGIDEFSTDDFRRIIETNLVSYFVACKSALPHLRKTRGTIINMGSLVGVFGQEGSCIYAATKGAIASFTKSLAIEESRFGVRVNCVSPGNILSESRARGVAASPDGEAMNKLVDSWQCFGYSGKNEDVGNLCLFLASEASAYITGADIIISGGSELGYGIKYPLPFFSGKAI